MFPEFKIAETQSFLKKRTKNVPAEIYHKIKTVVYSQLKKNPYFGSNIKKLKGKFEGIYRYKISRYRLFYTIDNDKIIVFVIDFRKRKDAYK